MFKQYIVHKSPFSGVANSCPTAHVKEINIRASRVCFQVA